MKYIDYVKKIVQCNIDGAEPGFSADVQGVGPWRTGGSSAPLFRNAHLDAGARRILEADKVDRPESRRCRSVTYFRSVAYL